jgi:hypothetical protein
LARFDAEIHDEDQPGFFRHLDEVDVFGETFPKLSGFVGIRLEEERVVDGSWSGSSLVEEAQQKVVPVDGH